MARGKSPSDFTNATDRMAWVRANPDAPITCVCNGNGCRTCAGEGTVPAWLVDPDINEGARPRRNG